MIQDIGKGRYHNEYNRKKDPEPESRVLGYRGRELLVRRKGEELSFLQYQEAVRLLPPGEDAWVYLFAIDETSYYWMPGLAWLRTDADASCRASGDSAGMLSGDSAGMPSGDSAGMPSGDSAGMPSGDSAGTHCGDSGDSAGTLLWEPVENLRRAVPRDAAFAGVTGFQLAQWYESRRYCPRCAQPMVQDERERMMRCPACGLMEYPKISPAVIVGVTCGDYLLLTKYAGRSYQKYALIAGFAEIGETIEETVAREVMEEVGLRVKNIRYYKSQPWSFTGTLLMGFFAELDGEDEIRLDETELSEAVWCPRGEVPEDDGVSLTREMMRVFREGGV